MINRLQELLNNLKELRDNIDNYIRLTIVDNEAIICDMNSQTQLFEQGIDRLGRAISSYAPYTERTIAVKLAQGKPTNRVTLRDTGDFHASFVVYADKDKFFIDATDWKTNRLGEKYGEEIFGLTEDNLYILIWEYIYPALMERVREL